MEENLFGNDLVSNEALVEIGKATSLNSIWTRRFEGLNNQTIKDIDQNLSVLPDGAKKSARTIIGGMLMDSFPPSSSLLEEDKITMFSKAFPQVSVPGDASDSILLKEYNKQKKIHDALVKATFSSGVAKSLRLGLLKLILSHFPYAMHWHPIKGFKKRPGRKKEMVRSFCIACLVKIFRQNGCVSDNKALDKIYLIMAKIKLQLTPDGLKSAYKSGLKIIKE